jgi:hypothetical protein
MLTFLRLPKTALAWYCCKRSVTSITVCESELYGGLWLEDQPVALKIPEIAAWMVKTRLNAAFSASSQTVLFDLLDFAVTR